MSSSASSRSRRSPGGSQSSQVSHIAEIIEMVVNPVAINTNSPLHLAKTPTKHKFDMNEPDSTKVHTVPVPVIDLEVYLNGVTQGLTEEQTDQILQILKAPKDTSQLNQNTNNAENHEDHDVYIFDVNDTLLQFVFKENIARKIKNVVEHKLIIILIVVLSGIPMIYDGIVFYDRTFNPTTHAASVSHYFGFTMLIMWILWLTFKNLLLNRVAFKLCLKSFDYWIKVGYMCMFGFSVVIHGHP
eukprot:139634_1